jgi:hypothetical protein
VKIWIIALEILAGSFIVFTLLYGFASLGDGTGTAMTNFMSAGFWLLVLAVADGQRKKSAKTQKARSQQSGAEDDV